MSCPRSVRRNTLYNNIYSFVNVYVISFPMKGKADKSRGKPSGSKSPGRARRFPYLLSIGVTPEIMAGLEAGTHNGLFSISDSARLALVNGLVSSGHYPPNLNQQQQLQNGSNGQHGPV